MPDDKHLDLSSFQSCLGQICGVGFVDCGCSRHDGLSESACTVYDHMHVKSNDTTEVIHSGCCYTQSVFLYTVDVLVHSGCSYTQWVFLVSKHGA